MLHILVIDADIANVWEGEGKDLRHIGRVGQDFLIAGHGGVETHFAECVTDGTDADTLENGAIGQCQNTRRTAHQLMGHGLAPP